MAENFRSNFVFGLQGNLYQDFIDKVASSIIQEVIGTDDYEIISSDKHLSFFDFDYSKRKESIFPEFYFNFLSDIQKENNKVSFRKKVCITLDEELCTGICPNTGRKITAIELGGVKLAYFIYFDIGEFFYFVKNYQESEIKKELYDNGCKDFIDKYDDKKEINKFTEVNSLKDLGYLIQLNNPNLSQHNQNRKQNNYHIETKIGYIHNHNDGYSYIRTSTNRKETFRVPHRVFPEIKEFSVGTVIRAECGIDEYHQVKRVYSYDQCSEKELNFSFEEFEGKLERETGKNFTFIKNYGTSIYVPPSLAKYFNEGQVYNVQCLAVESLDNNGNLGWEALDIIEILPFNWKATKKLNGK